MLSTEVLVAARLFTFNSEQQSDLQHGDQSCDFSVEGLETFVEIFVAVVCFN